MTYGPGDLKVLQYGVAARLHLDPRDFRVIFNPSTYAGAPAGIRDESATLRVLHFRGNHRGVHVTAYTTDGKTVSQVADMCVEAFKEDTKCRRCGELGYNNDGLCTGCYRVIMDAMKDHSV